MYFYILDFLFISLTSAKELLLKELWNPLPFCRKFLDRAGESNYQQVLNNLVTQGIVQAYHPLWDEKGHDCSVMTVPH